MKASSSMTRWILGANIFLSSNFSLKPSLQSLHLLSRSELRGKSIVSQIAKMWWGLMTLRYLRTCLVSLEMVLVSLLVTARSRAARVSLISRRRVCTGCSSFGGSLASTSMGSGALLVDIQKIFKSTENQQQSRMITEIVKVLGEEKTSYVFLIISQILFPLSFIYVNQNNFNAMQTSMIRGGAVCLVNFCCLRYYGMTADYKYSHNFKHMLIRNSIFVAHGIALTVVQFYLPMPIVLTINSSAPIFIFIMDYFINGITINKLQFISLSFGVVGIIVTINDELIQKFLANNTNYQIQTEFRNYISKDPQEVAIATAAFSGVMLLWAYALLRVRVFVNINHLHINFHLGMLFVFSAGLLYPLRVTNPMPPYKLLISFFTTGLVMTIAQMLMVPALRLNKNTGALNTCQFISVIMGYLISFVRYGEKPNNVELAGLAFIIVGTLGVVNCGTVATQNEIGAPPVINNAANFMKITS